VSLRLCRALEASYINQLFQPNLQDPILVEGLPGFGDVGKLAAKSLIQVCQAKLFAEYYSPYFPDYVVVSKEGVCSPPHYRFHASPSEDGSSVVILTGNAQPPLDNVTAHYEICEEILAYAQETLGCSFMITTGGTPVSTDKKEVYVAATSTALAKEVTEKGGSIYGKGRILGTTGLLLGLAKERGLDGICLLGATTGMQPDKDAGRAISQFVLRILGKGSPQAQSG
jgi:proteasome assembly chaperone (PAC2) family protein